jgi:hypothetical protein
MTVSANTWFRLTPDFIAPLPYASVQHGCLPPDAICRRNFQLIVYKSQYKTTKPFKICISIVLIMVSLINFEPRLFENQRKNPLTHFAKQFRRRYPYELRARTLTYIPDITGYDGREY